jgi:pimeloyl-ACP methyl ester carboxylesterase
MDSVRPRILLMPVLTELEWTIKPQLEEWADVATYDAPGVGDEPPARLPPAEARIKRGIEELDRRGWRSCIVAGDEFGANTALRLTREHPERVEALALGHACLSYRRHGERPPLNPEITALEQQLGEIDHRMLTRQMFESWRQTGQIDLSAEEVERCFVEPYLARVSREAATAWLQALLDAEGTPEADNEALLSSVDVPLLLVGHAACLMWTSEGFEDAVVAFPDARIGTTHTKPSMSDEFVELLREFCAEVAAVRP